MSPNKSSDVIERRRRAHRDAERRRREKIRADPERYEEFKRKDRERRRGQGKSKKLSMHLPLKIVKNQNLEWRQILQKQKRWRVDEKFKQGIDGSTGISNKVISSSGQQYLSRTTVSSNYSRPSKQCFQDFPVKMARKVLQPPKYIEIKITKDKSKLEPENEYTRIRFDGIKWSVENKEKPRVHKGYSCNECGESICGYRYTCVQCENYDLCAACEASGAHATHYVLRVPRPTRFGELKTLLDCVRENIFGNKSDGAEVSGDFSGDLSDEFKTEFEADLYGNSPPVKIENEEDGLYSDNYSLNDVKSEECHLYDESSVPIKIQSEDGLCKENDMPNTMNYEDPDLYSENSLSNANESEWHDSSYIEIDGRCDKSAPTINLPILRILKKRKKRAKGDDVTAFHVHNRDVTVFKGQYGVSYETDDDQTSHTEHDDEPIQYKEECESAEIGYPFLGVHTVAKRKRDSKRACEVIAEKVSPKYDGKLNLVVSEYE